MVLGRRVYFRKAHVRNGFFHRYGGQFDVLKAKLVYLRMVWRSYGPNEHFKTIWRAQDSTKLENEASNQGGHLLTDRCINGF